MRTNEQLEDILTKGSFASAQLKSLLCLIDVIAVQQRIPGVICIKSPQGKRQAHPRDNKPPKITSSVVRMR